MALTPALAGVALGVLFGVSACMEQADPEDATLLGATEAEGPAARVPQRHGDDEVLDGMQDDCEGGELLACDLLWLASPEGSTYERVGLTCGGTAEDTDEFCTPYIELDDSGYAPEGSKVPVQLAGLCEDGNMTACDVLFLILPEGHELEEVALTCGGRFEGGPAVDCRTERR